MSDWREDYQINGPGVDPSDYCNQDDFMDSLRNNEHRMNEQFAENKPSHSFAKATAAYAAVSALNQNKKQDVDTNRFAMQFNTVDKTPAENNHSDPPWATRQILSKEAGIAIMLASVDAVITMLVIVAILAGR